MNRIVCIILFCFPITAVYSQTQSISVIDFVRIKDQHDKEALFFYEKNWKAYRELALKRKFIKSYRLLQMTADSLANFDLILITEYVDSLQWSKSEDRFQAIIKEIRPDGPLLLNNLKPSYFRQNVFLKQTKTLFSSEK